MLYFLFKARPIFLKSVSKNKIRKYMRSRHFLQWWLREWNCLTGLGMTQLVKRRITIVLQANFLFLLGLFEKFRQNSSSCFSCSHHFCSCIRLCWENEAHWFNNWQECSICRKYWWVALLCKCSNFDFL